MKTNKPNNKVEEIVEQSIRKYFSVITPKAGLLKGKEQIAGTITLYMLKNFVIGEIAKACDTSSYEQGVRDERERIEKITDGMRVPHKSVDMASKYYWEKVGFNTAIDELLQALKNN